MSGDASRFNGKKGGRPRGKKMRKTLEKEAFQEYVRQKVLEKKGPIIDAMLDSAINQKNTQAFTALRDTGWGKPKEHLEVEGVAEHILIFDKRHGKTSDNP